jgi:hypothetical protein
LDSACISAVVKPVMPEWSPVRRFGGYAAWGDQGRGEMHRPQLAEACRCASGCGVHRHRHRRAWAGTAPVDDFKSFWGALGCSCFAF